MKNAIAAFLFSLAIFLMVAFLIPNETCAQKRPVKRNLKEGPEPHFREAVAHYKKKEPAKSEEILVKITEHYPQFPPAWSLMAKIHQDRQDYKGAKKIVYHALKLNPENRLLNLLAAKILFKENKLLKALEFLNRAERSTDPSDHEIDAGETNLDEMKKQIALAISRQSKATPQFYTKQTGDNTDWQSKLPAIPEEKKLKIAVLPFQFNTPTGGPDTTVSQIGNTISDMLTTSMVQTNCFMVVERQQLDKILIEQDFEMGDVIGQSTAVRVGELMGVDAVFIGALTQLGSQTEIDGRLVNIQSGQIICASNANYSSQEQIRTAVNSLMVSITQSAYK